MAKKRDYGKEYREYHGKPSQKKNRALRNAANRSARRSGALKKGDGREVDHRVPLKRGGGNSSGNLRVVSRKTNRRKGSR